MPATTTTTVLLLGLVGAHVPTSSSLSTGGKMMMMPPLPPTTTMLRQLPAPCGEFLVPCNLSYHNVATLGIMPRAAMLATRSDMDLLQSLTANEYFGGGSVMDLPGPTFLERMDTVRGQAASYLGCDLSETMLFPSTTTALNAVTNGLVEGDLLKPGDRVLTTDQEHAGGIAGWVHYNESGAIALDVVHLPLPDTRTVAEVVADFKAHMTPNTKVCWLGIYLTLRYMHRPCLFCSTWNDDAVGGAVNAGGLLELLGCRLSLSVT